MKANVIVFEISTILFFIAAFIGARLVLGKSRCRAFLTGAVFFSLAAETVAVALGGKNFFWYEIHSYYSHYTPTGFLLWFGLVPGAACLLMAMVLLFSYLSTFTLMEKSALWKKASAAGVVAVFFQLLIQPVAVTNHWWTWNMKSFYFLDVPVLLYLATFLGTYIFTRIYHRTFVEGADCTGLATLERLTVRRWPIMSMQPLGELRWIQVIQVFSFRLIAGFGILVASTAPFVLLFWAIANRGMIPLGW